MIPRPSRSLTDLAVRMAARLTPSVDTQFGQAEVGLISGLLLTFAQDFERSVGILMQDIDELRIVFDAASAAPGAAARDAFAAARPASFMLSDVRALHARGLELLIDLHAWAERHDPDLDLEIWCFLRRHSERGKYEVPDT